MTAITDGQCEETTEDREWRLARRDYHPTANRRLRKEGKDKVFPYSLPSVGPGADPGVQAVSPQVV